MTTKDKIEKLIKIIIKEIKTYKEEENSEELLLSIINDLNKNSLEEISIKYIIPLETVRKIFFFIQKPLSKAEETSFLFFLKRNNFYCEDYDFIDQLELYEIISDELTELSIREIAEQEGLPTNIVQEVDRILNIQYDKMLNLE